MGKYTTNDAVVPSENPDAPTLDSPAFGGRLDVCWDPNAEVTQWGGLCYLSAFLNVAGLLDRLVEDAPFVYTSNNSPGMRNLVGTIVLSILCGFTRYLHIERLRNDTACAKLLGMTKIVSETCVRRALKEHVDKAALEAWLLKHERETTRALLKFPYVLDIDNTVRPIYGHQEGAEVGYNPQKPGRPSHNFHSYFIGVARITLGVDVQPGKRHSGGCGMTSLWTFLNRRPSRESGKPEIEMRPKRRGRPKKNALVPVSSPAILHRAAPWHGSSPSWRTGGTCSAASRIPTSISNRSRPVRGS